MNLSQQKNILMNSLTKEEILIQSLIEEIYDAEKKISEINNSKNNIQNNNYKNNQKLSELRDLQDTFYQRIKSLNDKYLKEFEIKKDNIALQKKQINELDMTLNEYQKEIESFNLDELKSPLLRNIIDKDMNNKILSQKEINEIYLSRNEIETERLKELKRQIEIYKASESVILNNQKELKNNLDKINENLQMLKEEKLVINDELFDIISYKETLESINKNNLLNLTKLIKNNNDIISDDNFIKKVENLKEVKEPIKLFFFELTIIDFNEVPSKLYEEISNSFSFILTNNKNKINDKKKTYYNRSQSKETYTIEIYDKRKIYNKDIIKETNNQNKSLNNSYINSFYENVIFDKISFESLISTELNSFLKENDEFQINDCLNNIALIIIEQMKKNEIEIPVYFNDNTVIYLSYFFKILYYDKVIKNKLKFVNKEYKSIKKEYKKAKEFTNNELLKLENKYDEINNKKIENENK